VPPDKMDAADQNGRSAFFIAGMIITETVGRTLTALAIMAETAGHFSKAWKIIKEIVRSSFYDMKDKNRSEKAAF